MPMEPKDTFYLNQYVQRLEKEKRDTGRELARLRAENAKLRAHLDDYSQHPGFPQPPARVTNPDEPNGTCPTRGTIFGDGDPDEPVAGTG